MSDLDRILARLGLSQYLSTLVDEGFHSWQTVLDITEADLQELGFKRGHRRILQREIASSRGIPSSQSLVPHSYTPTDESPDQEESNPGALRTGDVKLSSGKRKYRRHPKPDENAPEKPPSAYVMFANRVRDDLKGQNLTFTEIAKLVGEKWKVLDSDEKEHFEYEASIAKEKYNQELGEYKKTDHYREYFQYLQDFKAKVSKDGSAARGRTRDVTSPDAQPMDVWEGKKKPRLEPRIDMQPMAQSLPSSASTSERGSVHSPSGPAPYTTSPGTQRSLYAVGTAPTLPPLAGQPSPPPTGSFPTVAKYSDAMARTTREQAQDMVPTVHNPIIQPHLSYSRHQPHVMPSPMGYGGRQPTLPVSNLRRPTVRHDETQMSMASISSSGSSSAGITPFDRALPPPTASAGAPSGTGYFDQRGLPAPAPLMHSSPAGASAYPTPDTQPLPTGSSTSSGSSLPSFTSLPPPPPAPK